MKVFGIGLNKTGTTSLGKALEILGFEKHQSCNLDLTKEWAANNLKAILSIAEKNNNFEDWPWPLVYKEIYKEFKDAKFILTKRSSADKWYESLCKHSLETGPTEFRKLIYGHYMPHDFKEEHVNFYNQHNKEVISFFNQNAPEKLLVISFEEGKNWEKLCSFLKKDVPEVEFPLLNKSKAATKHNSAIQVKHKTLVQFVKLVRKIRGN